MLFSPNITQCTKKEAPDQGELNSDISILISSCEPNNSIRQFNVACFEKLVCTHV